MPKQRQIAREHKNAALKTLTNQQLDAEKIKQLWADFRVDYFFRHNVDNIVWHTTELLNHPLDAPKVFIKTNKERGGTEICIYSPDKPYLFASVSYEISIRNLHIQDALIITNKKNYALDTFIVLDPKGNPVSVDRFESIIQGIEKRLKKTHYEHLPIKKVSTKLASFNVTTEISFSSMANERKTYMKLKSLDRPGLLASIGEVFSSLEINLHSAKIATMGEYVEDFFILTEKSNTALDEDRCLQLQKSLLNALDN